MKYLIIYLLIINAAGFLLMRIDKKKARRHRRRIPEAVLMGVAGVGGSIGVLGGMYAFHHKTRHARFTVGIPALLASQLMVASLIILFSQ